MHQARGPQSAILPFAPVVARSVPFLLNGKLFEVHGPSQHAAAGYAISACRRMTVGRITSLRWSLSPRLSRQASNGAVRRLRASDGLYALTTIHNALSSSVILGNVIRHIRKTDSGSRPTLRRSSPPR